MLLITDTRILTGGLVTCDWLRPVTLEVRLVAHPISVAAHTAVIYFGSWVMCTRTTCVNRRSVLLLTWTHVVLIILCCLTDLYFHLWRTCRTVPDCVPVLQGPFDQPARDSPPDVYLLGVHFVLCDGVCRRSARR